ncbi:MAG: AMP-binding protein [Nocardioidaceae bacterium]|nr:AMP-binding protein [Nocardioidaceae bacterium]
MTRTAHSFSLADLVREQARTLPGLPALVDTAGTLTYGEIDELSGVLADRLRAAGLPPGGRVVWFGPDDRRYVVALFAVARAGGSMLPLNWRCTAAELAGHLSQARPDVVLTAHHDRAETALPPTSAPVIDLDAAGEPGPGETQPATRPATAPAPVEPVVDDEEPVIEFFTAAFSGRSRIAGVPHRAIVTQSLVMGALGEVDAREEVYLASGPMFHMGVLLKLLANYLFGNPVVIAGTGDPEELCRLVEEHRVTSAYLFKPTLQRIVELNADKTFDLSSLRMIPDVPPDAVAEQWYAMTSCPRRDPSWVMGYGQTETWGMVALTARGPATEARFGRPSPVAVVRVLDRAGEEARPGEPGEITVRGPQLMTGYDAGWLDAEEHRTGDVGIRRADGGLDFLGPMRALIKSGMENVYPAEVEAVLLEHPAVTAACVVGVPDPVWGERVCAALVTAPGHTLDEAEAVAHVRGRIASYKKPREVRIVASLPIGAAGVDRDAVRRLFETHEENPADAPR